MGYATYDFYTKKYFGNSIAEAEFDKWNERASRKVDALTSRRLLTAYPNDAYSSEQIKLCVCALAEKMMEIDKYMAASAIQSDGKSKIVQSVSAGSESISYAAVDTMYASAVKDQQSMNRMYYNTVAEYLEDITDANGECLLFRGM
ncbi:MAG: hypothetical protein NC311_08695 [Muribaculaceae bacterium]|nr:hypothetical protein [Muribaculaceae bacterium]MCM1399871.1 hypothetical protein [Clostridium sp.]MCM1460644.1 hypothetical protein [Bacteroides sp.]